MEKILLILLFLISSAFAQTDYYSAFLYKEDITAKRAYFLQTSENVLIIDVRTKAEFKEGRAKDSINIPLFKLINDKRVFNKNFLKEVFILLNNDVNKKVILICRSGSRTKVASNLLAEQGFRNVYNVKKGFSYDWKINSLPMSK
ncbi:MAG: rhodanese-like domain-containing protein [Campylobacteraceae bacterium]|nr:rhodanese-like domain-containing protein [Campylobacteraceae bacterium]